jgi:branched-chain amino acid transport system substrate-binding protein
MDQEKPKKTNWWLPVGIIVILVVLLGGLTLWQNNKASQEPYKIGFIGAMTGPVAKYGSYEAVKLAVDDINNSGGIKGHPIQLIAEDGKCDSASAVSAMNKLIDVDKVQIVLGGHCTPESLAIAPIAESKHILILASITTSPALSQYTSKGDYVVRTSPVSVIQSDIVSDYAYSDLNLKKMAVVYEQTDYARPIAEKMRDDLDKLGGNTAVYEAYNPGTTDFRTILTKIKSSGVDSIYLSAQSPDAALNFMKQAKELGLNNLKLFGNDVAGNQATINSAPDIYEGFVLALPDFDTSTGKPKEFLDKYNAAYNTTVLPYGVWTAECYDAVKIIANEISKRGMDVGKINTDLRSLKDYNGVSGTFSIGSNGDGIRNYSLKIVKDGKIVNLNP